ncbi:TonB-dependent receptor [Chitinophaga rhizophila]|uniref:TonB-dependent receptor n=1 Tax=Chitinophaga rhizophila TaxID=2866212 RepID=A0ABS7GHN8_9BACT|nr:TonB-dependent receptor [Chitinophaga rhizophila]MBW8687207.1 TonB-dependent receptor [Chitinophaga rhizophila]
MIITTICLRKIIPVYLIIFLAITSHAIAQTPFGKISGIVNDSTGYPPNALNIFLLHDSTGKIVSSVMPDSIGTFVFDRIAHGKYRLGIIATGYKQEMRGPFFINKETTSINAGIIRLTGNSSQLRELLVKGQKPLLQISNNKTVYHVENDINKDNYSTTEMLRNVPGVMVDGSGNIYLKGNTNFRVYLNGKSASFLANDPKEALKMLPAGSIKSIEVVFSPSAKYDGEGAAGIINIITKKKITGNNGQLNANGHTLGTFSGNGLLNIRTGNLILSANTAASRYNYDATLDTRQYSHVKANEYDFSRAMATNLRINNIQGGLDLSYEIDSASNLTVYGNIADKSTGNFSTENNILITPQASTPNPGMLGIDNKNTDVNYDAGIDYNAPLGKSGAFVLSGNYNRQNLHINNDIAQTVKNNPPAFYRNRNKQTLTQTTLQADYTVGFKKNKRLETGLKFIGRDIVSNYEQHLMNPDHVYEPNTDRADYFNYELNIMAGYTMFHFPISSAWSASLGMRVEHTLVNTIAGNNKNTRDSYTHPLPSVNIQWNVNADNQLAMNYSQRLQRPWIENLNPLYNDNDPYNVSFGNPYLTPEKTSSFSIEWMNSPKNIAVSIGQIFTTNSIEAYTIPAPGSNSALSSFYNIGKRYNTNIGLNYSFNLSARWNTSINVQGIYMRVVSTDDHNYANSLLSANGAFRTGYSWDNGLKVEGSLYFYTSNPTLQGHSSGWVTYNITARKTFFQDKLGISVGVERFFQRHNIYRDKIESPDFYQYMIYKTLARAARMGITWKFGHSSIAGSHKTGVNNDDLKPSIKTR